MSNPSAPMAPRDWNLIATLAIFLAVQTGGMIWWASGITTSAKFTADTVADLKIKMDSLNTVATVNATQDLRLGNLENRATAVEGRVRDLERAK